MPFLALRISGIDELRARIAAIRVALPIAMQGAMQNIGDAVTADLQARSPVGTDDESDPPEGDGPGRLRDSFESTVESQGDTQTTLIVRTTQPQKLAWVVNGRGDVYPVNKQALFWKGLGHPVKHSGPSQPNDFVDPVLMQVENYATSAFDEAIAVALEG